MCSSDLFPSHDKQGVKDGINVLKADGSWSKLYYEVLNSKSLIDKILITKKGYKWVNIPRETPGIFVFDDKGTLDDVSDDVSNFYNLFTDSNGKTIGTVHWNQLYRVARKEIMFV